MKIENLLENIGLDFKIVDETKKLKIIKIPSKLHICFMIQKGNQFLIDRETFEYLDANSLPYCLLLQDITKNKYYYISLEKENNWIKSCFAGCDKEEIYLGKQVLNAQIQLEELGKKLSKYK
ncbi:MULTISPECIES: hypothetical protein [Bacillota]|uniref:Uncharacterized protein n=1 Tax=Anaerotignum neopropionicum TaxID=36847 RepID=A0A136WGH8_9FIRM|nr:MULTISPECIES: hypothetical protein [Bacillota]KXL53615.1 hypothetical protein CLNEO_08410 [Anaerotignum neopropionicum]WSI03066.1 hypothetical protein U8307_08410 [Sedimentibacter sp. MB36-C1]